MAGPETAQTGASSPGPWGVGRLEVDERLRPVALVAPHTATALPGGGALPRPAPYAALQGRPAAGADRCDLTLTAGGVRLTGWYDAAEGAVGLTVTTPGRPSSTHRSRRHGRPSTTPELLGLTVTGPQVTLLTREEGTWRTRARYDLTGRHDPGSVEWGGLRAESHGVGELHGGGFGQLGLRDVRVVSEPDGTPVREADGALWLTATSAGPGFFPTGHTSVWRLRLRAPGETAPSTLEHTGDLFFRRAGADGVARVYGDHATHLVRTGSDGWLVATSTWADFDRERNPAVRAVLAQAGPGTDLRVGEHVLEAEDLPLPTDGLRSVGVWDPHLVHTGEEWLVGFVSARRFFRFHPALARGSDLARLRLAGAATDRRATEGTTLVRLTSPEDIPGDPSGDGPGGLDGTWRVLASDGRDGRRGQREHFPVFDLSLRECGRLDAAYPTNIPWPTLVRTQHGWAMVTFNGRRYGGELAGYGTHGDLVLLREAARD